MWRPGSRTRPCSSPRPLGYAVIYQQAAHAAGRPAETGQAVLAAPGWSIGASTHLKLAGGPPTAKDATRIALQVELAGPFGPLRVVNAHLSLDPAARLQSIAAILAWLGRSAPLGGPTLLGGDLNEGPAGAALTRLRSAGWQDCWAALYPHDTGATFPLPAPAVRFDYLWQAPGLGWRPLRAQRVGLLPDSGGFYPSDHAGLLVEFAG